MRVASAALLIPVVLAMWLRDQSAGCIAAWAGVCHSLGAAREGGARGSDPCGATTDGRKGLACEPATAGTEGRAPTAKPAEPSTAKPAAPSAAHAIDTISGKATGNGDRKATGVIDREAGRTIDGKAGSAQRGGRKACGANAGRTEGSAPPATPRVSALDLETLKEQLKGTKAIGVFTKLTLKNQVDDLLDRFRDHYAGKGKVTMTELRQSYDMLMMKVLSLLQDKDQKLATDIVASREAIWGLLADKEKFAALDV